jgi:DNA-binding MarR family transcriptional regulator
VAPAQVDPAALVRTTVLAGRALQRLLIAQSRASGLGLLEFLVLTRAVEGPGVTPGEAGRFLGLSTSTMAGLCDRLETAELVQRLPHPSDRRLVLLKATAEGRTLRDRVLEPTLTRLRAEAGALGSAERAVVARYLEHVIEHVTDGADALAARPADSGARAPVGARARVSTPRRARSNPR